MWIRTLVKPLVWVIPLLLMGCNKEIKEGLGLDDKEDRVQEVSSPPAPTLTAPSKALNRPTGGDYTKATDTYGELVVSPGEFEVEAKIVPWSSWWYPLWDDSLFRSKSGQLSPLEKYDLFNYRVNGNNSDASTVERAELFEPDAVKWAGLCDAWAVASVLHPEPKTPKNRNGVIFSVGDQKALLLKTYESVTGLQKFGERFDAEWDHLFDDVYPDQFHRFLQVQLFERQLPFIMDYDPGFQVWATPAWKVITRVERDAADENLVHVKTWLTTASPHVKDKNFVGTMPIVRIYTYDLYGYWDGHGQFHVQYGLWTDRSQWDHPDYLIPYPENIERKSFNSEIDPAVVDMILGP